MSEYSNIMNHCTAIDAQIDRVLKSWIIPQPPAPSKVTVLVYPNSSMAEFMVLFPDETLRIVKGELPGEAAIKGRLLELHGPTEAVFTFIRRYGCRLAA